MVNYSRDIALVIEIYRNHNIYVSVSGGVDSIFLLDLFHKNAFSVNAIHINYNLRGKESNDDAAFVKSFCETRNIPLVIKNVDLNKDLIGGGNLQEKARNIRYAWYQEILAENPNNRVALAHHLDDQVETFYLNLARKSGVMGLSCMLPEHNGIIRPLLNYNKSTIVKMSRKEGLQWREDSSNKKSTYSRNKLRNEILPFLRSEIPTIDESISTLIDKFQLLQRELESTIQSLRQTILSTGRIKENELKILSELEQVELFRSLSLSVKTLNEVLNLKQKGTKILIEGNEYFTSIFKEADGYSFIGKIVELKPTLQITPCNSLPQFFSLDKLYLDTSDIKGELSIRKWKIGDRISPIGVNGSKLISDILSDAKLTYEEKQNTYVLLQDNTILWCVGYKISKEAISNSKSGNYVCIELIY